MKIEDHFWKFFGSAGYKYVLIKMDFKTLKIDAILYMWFVLWGPELQNQNTDWNVLFIVVTKLLDFCGCQIFNKSTRFWIITENFSICSFSLYLPQGPKVYEGKSKRLFRKFKNAHTRLCTKKPQRHKPPFFNDF